MYSLDIDLLAARRDLLVFFYWKPIIIADG